MAFAPYVPLRNFSAYTMLEGAIDPKAIAATAKARGFPAAAICDRNGLYGAMPFAEGCTKSGVQPIIGTLLSVARPEGTAPGIDWLALYAQDESGYDNLCALVSQAHLARPVDEPPHVSFAALTKHSAGLIALTAGGEGALVRLLADGQGPAARDYLEQLRAVFRDRIYVEVSRRGDAIEGQAEAALVGLADDMEVPVVATNPAHYANAEFHAAHDIMLCIAGSAYVDSDDRAKSSPEAWIKPIEAMQALFGDLPDALANTLVVARRCAVSAPNRKPILPSLAGDRTAEAEQLRVDARAGLELRLEQAGNVDVQIYRDRLEFELDVIVGMGFPGYFLIVADFIKWAKEQGIPVGPGRGSGAGSVVAWSLTITDLDPLKLGLLFERFLNPERVSMPDFDIDFCETRREEVIRYVQGRYGRDHVAQIITFGRLKARAVLKDTGRVLQMSYGQVDRLAKLIPNHPTDPWTLDRSLNGVSELAAAYKNDEEVKRLFDLAMKLEGLPRHSSTHAAGVVIGDRPLDQLVPLYRDPRSDMPVTQFDMKYVEAAGLVKFDFLGLKTLSVLHRALDMIEAREGHRPDLDRLGWDDEAVYQLLQRGDTVGVFQLESEGMRRALAGVKPSSFADIIAIGALYRPGPMDNIPMFGRRKNGQEDILYPHPLLETVLAETYGVIVYQEQVMQAAQILAGYSLGEADLLRRAMGKKVQAEMDAQRQRFIDGCAANEIEPRKASELFDLIDKFAGYGFNKSHAAAYAVLSYQTAWLKVHYPHDFFAASMAFDRTNTDKLAIFVDDMRRSNVAMLPPCINASGADFTVETTEDGLAVRHALAALKGVGEGAMEQLVATREAGGKFKSIDDFADRVPPRMLNKRQLEALAGSGAFDGIEPNRAGVFAVAETMLAVANSAEERRTGGQHGLFGGEASVTAIKLPKSASWSLAERMTSEKEAFGFYFSAHPVDRYRHAASAHGARSHAALCAAASPEEGARTAGVLAALVEDARWRTSARGRRYLMATLSDASGQYVATCFDDAPSLALEEAARSGACQLLQVELDRRAGEETPRVTIRGARSLDGLAGETRLSIRLVIDKAGDLSALATLLATRVGGRGEVHAEARFAEGIAQLTLGRNFRLDGEVIDQLGAVAGVVAVETLTNVPKLALAS
ncbi:DNA polymerase III subunit alpha [Sphingomonas antarctica]|uniref:DNA polymerase III subunit alpha n=1 Tax=Sphingomonas antarctica TaxID=2040274 RepID=UPI0039E942AF